MYCRNTFLAIFVVKRPEKAQSPGCLMKQEFGFPFYIVYQAVMRKFTLAGKTRLALRLLRSPVLVVDAAHHHMEYPCA